MYTWFKPGPWLCFENSVYWVPCFNVSYFPFYSDHNLFGALFLDQEKFYEWYESFKCDNLMVRTHVPDRKLKNDLIMEMT